MIYLQIDLKNAAATKKLSYISTLLKSSTRMENEKEMLDDKPKEKEKDRRREPFKGFAEGRSK